MEIILLLVLIAAAVILVPVYGLAALAHVALWIVLLPFRLLGLLLGLLGVLLGAVATAAVAALGLAVAAVALLFMALVSPLFPLVAVGALVYWMMRRARRTAVRAQP